MVPSILLCSVIWLLLSSIVERHFLTLCILNWPSHLSWSTECGRRKVLCVQSLGFKKLYGFHFCPVATQLEVAVCRTAQPVWRCEAPWGLGSQGNSSQEYKWDHPESASSSLKASNDAVSQMISEKTSRSSSLLLRAEKKLSNMLVVDNSAGSCKNFFLFPEWCQVYEESWPQDLTEMFYDLGS